MKSHRQDKKNVIADRYVRGVLGQSGKRGENWNGKKDKPSHYADNLGDRGTSLYSREIRYHGTKHSHAVLCGTVREGQDMGKFLDAWIWLRLISNHRQHARGGRQS